MASSQFTIYTSEDPYGPGLLNGLTGSLIPILDAVLVNGYGSGSSYYKPAAGWTKPLPNSGSIYGCYKQASGSQYTMFVNDAGGTSFTGRDAQVTGWKLLTSLSSSISVARDSVGSGYGQFPLASQGQIYLVSGSVIWKKSSTADAINRPWIILADAYTMYMWISEGAVALQYSQYAFGDFYSLSSVPDNNKCFISGRGIVANAAVLGYDYSDSIACGPFGATPFIPQLVLGFAGNYIAGPISGYGSSIRFCKKGDCTVSPTGNQGGVTTVFFCNQAGVLACPNPADNNIYFSYIWVVEEGSSLLRGKLRGYYQVCHPMLSFANGQIIQGSGDFSGKTFMIIKFGVTNGFWAMEISPTVDTN